jgi:isopentenyl phosphate kinase
MMMIIKLGGSVITDKKVKYRFRPNVTDRLVKEFKPVIKKHQMVLVHGAGSFGHILSKKYELDKGFRSPGQLAKVAEVKKDVRELDLKILNILIKNGLNPISISPSSIISNNNKSISKIDLTAFEKPMALNFIPVTYGDIVMDSSLGFSICSGDQIILHLAKKYKPDRVILVTNVDGVYTRPPGKGRKTELIENINVRSKSDLELVKQIEAEMKVADVTGGIFEKLRISMEIAKSGVKADIINGTVKNRLNDCVKGRKVIGTTIQG